MVVLSPEHASNTAVDHLGSPTAGSCSTLHLAVHSSPSSLPTPPRCHLGASAYQALILAQGEKQLRRRSSQLATSCLIAALSNFQVALQECSPTTRQRQLRWSPLQITHIKYTKLKPRFRTKSPISAFDTRRNALVVLQ